MRRILVTGGAGFIGSHICRILLERGDHVICVDNLFTGTERNLVPFKGHPRFEFIRHDIVEPIDVQVDEIYNLACPASPVHYQYDPVHTMKTSVLGALNMLELAKKNKAKILQASTSEVYGDPHVHPQPESYWGNVNTIGPRACYDEGKRAAETLFFDYHRGHGVDIRIVRIFNTYGPNMNPDDGRVVSNFIMQALENKDITIYGEGKQTRSFQYVDDLVAGIITLMDNKKGFIGPANMGNPVEFTILELAELVLKMIPESKSKLAYAPLPQDDPQQRKPDISVAKNNLGWSPSIPLEEGLIKTIAYFREFAKKDAA